MNSPRNACPAIVAFAFAASAAMAAQVIYAPITTVAAQHYGTTVEAIGWLSQVFPLMYVLISIPAGLLMDRWFRGGLMVSASLVASGAILRWISDDFSWALAGHDDRHA